MDKKIIMLTVMLMFWLAVVEPTIDAIWNIADYGDILVVLVNKGTVVYLGIMIYAIYFDKQNIVNILSLTVAPILCVCWAYFFAWDLSDFIKHPNLGYWIFLLSPPILTSYCFYWVIYCLMTIFGKNTQLNTVV